MSMTDEEEKALREHADRMADTLREARNQMVACKDELDRSARMSAIAHSLDYAILGVDLRISEIKRAIISDTVGSEHDRGLDRASNESFVEVFEAALLGAGFRVVPLIEVSS